MSAGNKLNAPTKSNLPIMRKIIDTKKKIKGETFFFKYSLHDFHSKCPKKAPMYHVCMPLFFKIYASIQIKCTMELSSAI